MREMIHEIRIEETEDGYRIKIKGDKEHLRRFFEHRPFGMGMPFGFGFGFGPGAGRGPRHWRRGQRHWRCGPGGWGGWHWGDDPQEEGDSPSPYSV